MDVQIANRLAERRREAGLSQEALAGKLGVSRQAVSKWERSEASPDTDNLIALAQLYGVTLDELLYGTGARNVEDAQNCAEKSAEDAGEAAEPETDAAEQSEQGKQPANADADAYVEQDEQSENADTAAPADEQPAADDHASEHVHIGWDGIHVSKPGEEVHVGWNGIHVDNDAKDEHVHIGRNGIQVHDANGQTVETGSDGSVTVNGTHYASWHEAHDAFEHAHGKSDFLRAWDHFPYGPLVLVVILACGLGGSMWWPALLVFTIPVWHALGRTIDQRSPMPLLRSAIPCAVIAWAAWMLLF